MYKIMRSLSVASRSALVFVLVTVCSVDCDSMCMQIMQFVDDPYPRVYVGVVKFVLIFQFLADFAISACA